MHLKPGSIPKRAKNRYKPEGNSNHLSRFSDSQRRHRVFSRHHARLRLSSSSSEGSLSKYTATPEKTKAGKYTYLGSLEPFS
jgi:hypothetical protein